MSPITTISIVGEKLAGKTRLIEEVIKELRNKGYKVATIKHSACDFQIDYEDKDSYRHFTAGANQVVISSANKIALIKRVEKEYNLLKIKNELITDVDVILVEGYKKELTDKKIEVKKTTNYEEKTKEIVNFVEKTLKSKEREKEIEKVELYIDDKKIVLNKFVQNLIKNTLLGIVNSLKIDKIKEEVKIIIK